MAKGNLANRRSEFVRLQQEMAVATETFNRAARAKQSFLAGLGGYESLTLEHRQAFLDLIKVEQKAYRDAQDVQKKMLDLLRRDYLEQNQPPKPKK